MMDLVKLIGRDVSNIPIHIYNFNDKTSGWVRRPRHTYENFEFKPIIYLQLTSSFKKVIKNYNEK